MQGGQWLIIDQMGAFVAPQTRVSMRPRLRRRPQRVDDDMWRRGASSGRKTRKALLLQIVLPQFAVNDGSFLCWWHRHGNAASTHQHRCVTWIVICVSVFGWRWLIYNCHITHLCCSCSVYVRSSCWIHHESNVEIPNIDFLKCKFDTPCIWFSAFIAHDTLIHPFFFFFVSWKVKFPCG